MKKNSEKNFMIIKEKIPLFFVYEILTKTAEWLIKKGKLTHKDIPLKVSRGYRYLVNKKPKHQNGKKFINPKKLSNRLYIETNYNWWQTRNRAIDLLEFFGYSEALNDKDIEIKNIKSANIPDEF